MSSVVCETESLAGADAKTTVSISLVHNRQLTVCLDNASIQGYTENDGIVHKK